MPPSMQGREAHLKVADILLIPGGQNDKVGLLHLKVLCLAVICIASLANVGVLQGRAITLDRGMQRGW